MMLSEITIGIPSLDTWVNFGIPAGYVFLTAASVFIICKCAFRIEELTEQKKECDRFIVIIICAAIAAILGGIASTIMVCKIWDEVFTRIHL